MLPIVNLVDFHQPPHQSCSRLLFLDSNRYDQKVIWILTNNFIIAYQRQPSQQKGFWRMSKLQSALQKFSDELNEYFYEFDPNFDFQQREVSTPKNCQRKEKKELIGMYYQTKFESQQSSTLNESYSIDDFTEESSYIEDEEVKRSYYTPSTSRGAPKRRNISDIHLTKSLETTVAPDKMKKRPERKLKEICDANNYALSIKDFESTKILIGQGAFGEVYLVRCKLNDCKYALKVLNKEKVQMAGCERHLMREKEITNMLNHPNICRLEAYFMDAENCYFLFELCQVGDLH